MLFVIDADYFDLCEVAQAQLVNTQMGVQFVRPLSCLEIAAVERLS